MNDAGRPKVLSSGVFGVKSDEKPLISTTAVAMLAEGSSEVWVALMVDRAKDVATPEEAYGMHQVL